jgi:hypothetical protein
MITLDDAYYAKEEAFKKFVEELEDEDFVRLWNLFCEENNDFDGRILPMDEFNDLAEEQGETPLFWVSLGENGFCSDDDWFKTDGSDYESSDYPRELAYESDLVDWLADGPSANWGSVLGNGDFTILDTAFVKYVKEQTIYPEAQSIAEDTIVDWLFGKDYTEDWDCLVEQMLEDLEIKAEA